MAVAPPPAPVAEAGVPPTAALGTATPVASVAAGAVELSDGVRATPVYHGTVLLEAPGLRVWVDPWSKANLDGPPANVVLVTDIHFDHLDAEALAKVVGPDTEIVASPAVAAEYKGKVHHLLKNGEKADVKGMNIEAVPMYNLVRGPEAGKLFHDKGRGNGYLVTIAGQRIYIAGDTECTPEMKALTGVDLAFLPMNLPYTMTAEEAGDCAAAFQPKRLVPYHYAGTDLSVLTARLPAGVEWVQRDAYPGGLPW